jgi:hypothetical protein
MNQDRVATATMVRVLTVGVPVAVIIAGSQSSGPPAGEGTLSVTVAQSPADQPAPV